MRRSHWPPGKPTLGEMRPVATGHLSLAQSPKPPSKQTGCIERLEGRGCLPTPPPHFPGVRKMA
nr:MAG TPA: hypothetical protein [Caudoviricetes sp.]